MTKTSVQLNTLSPRHQVDLFNCGEDSLNIYIRRHALGAPKQGLAQTWVLEAEENRVLAYFTLAVASLLHADATDRVSKGLPRHPIPVILLGRLAVDQSQQGQGLGSLTLEAAMRKTLDLGRASAPNETQGFLPVRALLVHALHDRAAAFYRHHGFDASPSNPRHMMALLKDIEKSFR